jgi:hypothetical protein
MDKPFTVEFWQSQWSVVMGAPWLILPLLAIVTAIAWKIRGAIDDGEVRGLKAKNELLDAQFGALRSAGPSLQEQINTLRVEIADLQKKIRIHAEPEVLEQLATAVETTASDTGEFSVWLNSLLGAKDLEHFEALRSSRTVESKTKPWLKHTAKPSE